MFYGHTYMYTIVTVHSIKDCLALDQPLHHSYVMTLTTLLLPSELGNEAIRRLDNIIGVLRGGGTRGPCPPPPKIG